MEMSLFVRAVFAVAALGMVSYFAWFVWHCISTLKPQFTIRDLLLSTALIASGVACIATPIRLISDAELFPKCIFLLPPGPPLIVAGLMAPFTKGWRGFFALAIILAVLSIVAFYKQDPQSQRSVASVNTPSTFCQGDSHREAHFTHGFAVLWGPSTIWRRDNVGIGRLGWL